MAYKTVDEKFWTDPKIKQLKPLERYLILYLITNPHAHYCGLYYIPIALITEETNLEKKTIESAFILFQKLEIIIYDKECSTVLILNMLRYQNNQGGNPARIKQGIESQLKNIHSYELLKAFIDKYQAFNLTLPQGYGKVKVTLGQPSVTASVSVTGSSSDSVTDTASVKKGKNERFEKPMVEQIKQYCQERENTIDPEKFFDYYEANGWRVGKNPMSNWEAAVRTWEKNDRKSKQEEGVPQWLHEMADKIENS